MASIALPSKPGLKGAKLRFLDWGGRLIPPTGGPVLTLLRLGSRTGVEYPIPPMPSEPHGRIWSGKLREAKLSGVIVPYIQDGFAVGAPGAIVVNGAGQSGSSLAVRGGTPNYAVRYNQAFSIVHSGKRYLHFATAQTILDSSGAGLVPLIPMLRIIPSDGDVCEFGKPMIEGSLTGNEVAWDVLTAPWTDVGTIRIDEDE